MTQRFDSLAKFARENAPSKRIALSMNLIGDGVGGLEKIGGMAVPHVFQKHPNLAETLKKGVVTDPILMMIDLSPFSEVVKELTAEEIADFLDAYYNLVGKRVDINHGIVEKYIGDAVIALFGAPFENTTTKSRLSNTIAISRDLIKEISMKFKRQVTAKVALVHGDSFLGYVGPPQHRELTVIGNALTMLFRIESICPESSLIIQKDLYNNNIDSTEFPIVPSGTPGVEWTQNEIRPDLKGVGPVSLYTFTYDGV